MTTDEQLKIINRWCYKFTTHNTPNDTFYGRMLMASYQSFHKYTCERTSVDYVIEEAYDIVANAIWNLVHALDKIK